MKTNLTAWVAVDGDGRAHVYRLKPQHMVEYGEFVTGPNDWGPDIYIGKIKSLAGQCWRIEIPGPKKARKVKP